MESDDEFRYILFSIKDVKILNCWPERGGWEDEESFFLGGFCSMIMFSCIILYILHLKSTVLLNTGKSIAVIGICMTRSSKALENK